MSALAQPTRSVAIAGAETGAHVVASDLTPENFAGGRREAAARGVRLDWVEYVFEYLLVVARTAE